MGLDDDTALRAAGDGRYEGAISSQWATPRGALGGYVMAVLLRGLQMAVDAPDRQPRSLTVYFATPPRVGPIAVAATVERAGRSLTMASGRMEQDGKLLALALASFSGPWPGLEFDDAPMPEVEPAGERAAPSRSLTGGQRPGFVDRLVMQHRFGPPPFSGGDRAETGGWLGLMERRPVDALALAVLADAWFPASWARLEAIAPAPTIELTVHFRAPLPLPDTLLLARFHTRLARDGFFEEDGELWAPDGTLVAQSRQLALLLPPRGG